MADQDAAYEQLRAQLEIKREAAKSPEIEALEQKLAANPDDLDVRTSWRCNTPMPASSRKAWST